jgi:hypothetical protein
MLINGLNIADLRGNLMTYPMNLEGFTKIIGKDMEIGWGQRESPTRTECIGNLNRPKNLFIL